MLEKKTIDINCDLGEGGMEDAKLMRLISSCNIACGGHFGNEGTVKTTINLALRNHVNIGAHPSYPDPGNFGRKKMSIPSAELMDNLRKQILLVKETAEAADQNLHHVKPHGALYHELISNKSLAHMFVEMMAELDENCIVFAPPQSCLHSLAEDKLKIYTEGFADRTYQDDLGLLPRKLSGAVIVDKHKVAEQALSMLQLGKIPLETGKWIDFRPDTICIHGDTDNSLEILEYLRVELRNNNFEVC